MEDGHHGAVATAGDGQIAVKWIDGTTAGFSLRAERLDRIRVTVCVLDHRGCAFVGNPDVAGIIGALAARASQTRQRADEFALRIRIDGDVIARHVRKIEQCAALGLRSYPATGVGVEARRPGLHDAAAAARYQHGDGGERCEPNRWAYGYECTHDPVALLSNGCDVYDFLPKGSLAILCQAQTSAISPTCPFHP